MRNRLLLSLVLIAVTIPAHPQSTAKPLPTGATAVISLWPSGAPGFENRKEIPELAASYWVKNINNPSVTVFLPPKERATGAAVIICPGGGFRELGFVPEGIQAAQYFNGIGVAAFALKYRLPREDGSVYNMSHPHQDGLRAMRLVRSRAAEWGIDPNRIGMVGFSAGGEVVSMTAFAENGGNTNASDPIEKASARPDFIVEIYPGGAGIPQSLPVNVPPAFLLVANDDDHTNAVLDIFRLYRAAKAPVEVHVYEKGQHAFNMGNRSKLTTIKTWPQRMADWMADNNILDPTVPPKNVK